MQILKPLFGAVLLVSLTAPPSFAQEARGTIAGHVTDAQKAVIPGATIAITNTSTNTRTTIATNADGYFEAVLLNPGSYTVTAEAAGFKRLAQSGIEVSVAGRVQLELQLEVGQVTETMQVTAEAPLLDAISANAGRLLD